MSDLKFAKASKTSREAAIENWPKRETQKSAILRWLRANKDYGLTRPQLARYTDLSGDSVRPRVRELIEEGLVEETERTRKTASGSEASVLVATGAEPRPVERKQTRKRRLKEELLERIADEPAVSKAEDTYRAFKKAADDPWDDTGWAEPMSEALMAGLEVAFEEIEQR